MFEKFKSWIGGIGKKMRYAGITDIAKDRAAVTGDMEASIDLWMQLYRGEAPWISSQTHGHSLNLPSTIASEVARLVTLEMSVNFTGENERAKYIEEQFAALRGKLRRYVEYGCAGGGLMFKPYIKYVGGEGKEIAIDIVQADMFYPISFDSKGDIVSAAFVERKTIGKDVFSRIEKHFKENNGYRITNECYRSTNGTEVGSPALLSEVPEWASLTPEVHIAPLDSPLFAYFSIPQGNTTEPTSPLGVSVYARAINNIREADSLYDSYLWEYKSGERAIDASEDAFEVDRKGKPAIPSGQERLFRTNKFSTDDNTSQDLFREFSPDIRGEEFAKGLNGVKEIIEDNCGLAHGTISKQEYSAKTATEIKTMKQRSYSTITDIQKSLQNALTTLISAIDALASLYNLAPEGTYEVSYVWDDSIVTDSDVERTRDMQEVSQGLMLPHEFRMKWYGEDEETARARIAEIKNQTSNDVILGFGSGVV